jgi:BirA family biotin operon repressor/biotin-[acetyl-CoA-carboxylase] ligase
MRSVPVTVLETVDSTNDWCRRSFSQGDAAAFVCVAEQQTGGKGRRGRSWVAQAGNNITLSYTRTIAAPLHELGCLSLAAGMAVVKTLHQAGITDATLKWPNDVLVDNGKIAGVLIETLSLHPQMTTVVIGVGVNVDMPRVLPNDGSRCASMQQFVAAAIDRNRVIAGLLDNCERYCARFETSPEQVRQELKSYFSDAACVDVLLEGGRRVTGIMQGINEQGELCVMVDGELMVYNSADVSMRAVSSA